MSELSGQPGGVSPLVARKQQRPQFLTPREAAQVMRVSDDLMYDLIRAWLEEQRQGSAAWVG